LSNVKKIAKDDKKKFYECIVNHFLGYYENADYDAIERDVPLKVLRLPTSSVSNKYLK
jgi:hypothetical protein